MLIRAFEVSQFIRMIPFKVAINRKKAILFYGLACKLIKDLKNDYKKKLNSKTFPSLQWQITNTKKIDYSIVITKNLFNKNNNLLENKKTTILNNSRRLIFIDSNVNAYYQKNRRLFSIEKS